MHDIKTKYEHQFEEIVGNHSCSSCWSDDHDCTCEEEQNVMRGLKHFIFIDYTNALLAKVEEELRERIKNYPEKYSTIDGKIVIRKEDVLALIKEIFRTMR